MKLVLQRYKISKTSLQFLVSKNFQKTTSKAVYRARKIQRFLSQPFSVAEVFTGSPGKYVTLAETVRGFGEILDGKHDDKGEQDFYMKGGIDEVVK